jgi:hypothetical protein
MDDDETRCFDMVIAAESVEVTVLEEKSSG